MPWRRGKKGGVYRVKASGKRNGRSRRKTFRTKTAAKGGGKRKLFRRKRR